MKSEWTEEEKAPERLYLLSHLEEDEGDVGPAAPVDGVFETLLFGGVRVQVCDVLVPLYVCYTNVWVLFDEDVG
jgi:hypothetical protein